MNTHGTPIAIIHPSTLSGSLWVVEEGKARHYDAYLGADRQTILIIKWTLGLQGEPIGEDRETHTLKDLCNDPARSEDFIWWVRGFLGIPAKYGTELKSYAKR